MNIVERSENSVFSCMYDIAWLYCACSYEGGYSDWRIPTPTESSNFRINDCTWPYNAWAHVHPTKIYKVLNWHTERPVVPVRTKC